MSSILKLKVKSKKSKIGNRGRWTVDAGPVLKIIFAVLLIFLPVIVSAYTVSGPNMLAAGGGPANIVGVDVPYLLTQSDEQIDKAFKSMNAAGIKLARILASFCGESAYSFQPSAGVYNRKMFEKLDRTISTASKNGVALMIAFADNSSEFGGKEVYRKWTEGTNDNVFFKDRISMECFKKYMDAFLGRKNTATGKAYKSDKTIFAWDLCRDAQDDNDPDGSALYSWAMEMASYVKQKDPEHFVTMSVNKPCFEKEKFNDFNIYSGPDLDFIMYAFDAGKDASPAAITSSAAPFNDAYYENVGKPIAVSIENVPARSISAVAGALFISKISLILFNYAGFGDYKAKEGAYDLEDKTVAAQFSAASDAASKSAKIIKTIAISGISAAATSAGASISITLPEKSDVEVSYGQNMPLTGSTGIKSIGPAQGKIQIDGLLPDTKYIYMIKAKSGDRAGISAVRSFTTAKLIRLKALPFKRSNNFIKVKGINFYDGNKKYKFVGTNNYYMRHDDRGKTVADMIFAEAAKAGFKVIRVGSNGEAKNMESIDKKSINRFFRIGPDYFNEDAYKGLDYVLDSAARHGMRVILHFTDNWEYYGGARVYCAWAGLDNKNLFWTDSRVKGYYKQTIDKITNRKNTVNGKMYKNDPTIFAYDLLNEPRDEDDQTGKTLAAWVDEMSAYVKSQDPNHMVTTGMEGFFLKDDGTHYSGADFVLCHKPKTIDYCTFHIYPASQYNNFSISTTEWMMNKFIQTGHETLGKPVVMEEYGIPDGNPDFPKAKWIDDMNSMFFKADGDGVNYWMFVDSTKYGDANKVAPDETDFVNAFIKTANIINKDGY
jgi:mannan endo-1,4-beta-mannosidase